MSLFTRKGDVGTTKIYGCDQNMSKSSVVAEALGALAPLFSFGEIRADRKQNTKIILFLASE